MNQQQKKNLAILTLYCHSLPPGYDGFDMKWYVQNGGNDSFTHPVRKPEHMGCGTSACFAGHGPHAGIMGKNGEVWGQYVDRVFGCSIVEGANEGPWVWLFHSGWPNSIELALKRAAWLLQGGYVPEVDQSYSYDDNGKELEVLDWEEPDGFSTFTPDWDKITQIAHS
jgi:hypothetical protein